jgi:hypothetical protein
LIVIALSVAIAGVVAAAYGKPKQATDANSSAQNPPNRISQQPEPIVPLVIQNDIDRIANALETANKHPKAAGEEQQARDDLKAQRKIATSAQAMPWIAAFEVLVTLGGVVLVGLTLKATRRAAKAARKTVKQMRKNARLELRAYLEVVPIASPGMDTQEGMNVEIRITNSGQTPAHQLMIWNAFAVFKNEDVGSFGPGDTSWAKDLVNPRQSIVAKKLVDRALVKKNADDIKAGKQFVYLYGRIIYTDEFEDRWLRTFRFHLPGGNIIDGEWGACREGNECRRCTDDEDDRKKAPAFNN